MLKESSFIIIIITYNDKFNLSRTIESVRKNKKYYHKYYVIDGLSVDGSIDLIKDNSDIIDSYISESDCGIYDAMNKSIKFDLLDGDYILWLNSGDLLIDWSGINIERYLHFDCIFGGIITRYDINDHKDKIIYSNICNPYNERNFFPKTRFMHQSFIIKSEVFKRYMYDVSVGIQAENLLMSKCILETNYLVVQEILSIYYLDGVSSKKFYAVLKSYICVAKKLSFNIPKLVFFQKKFLIKNFVKIILPYKFFKVIRRLRS